METKVTYDISGTLDIENLVLLSTGISDNIDAIGNISANKIIGNAGNNEMVGDVGNDTLTGNAGNDTLIGGLGVDVMTGGAGRRFLRDRQDHRDLRHDRRRRWCPRRARHRAGFATATGYVLGANLEDIELADDGPITVIGNALGNKITGSDENSTLNGGAGVDTLIGGEGDNIYVVDRIEEYDVLIEDDLGVDNDEILHAVRRSHCRAHWPTSRMSTSSARQTWMRSATTSDNNVHRQFRPQQDRRPCRRRYAVWRRGADTMIGGLGDDRLHFDNLGDVLDEQAGEGNDTVEATLSVDLRLDRFKNIENVDIIGGAALFAIGNEFANEILGNFGSTSSNGLDGNDTIQGFNGNDTIDGGDGADDM